MVLIITRLILKNSEDKINTFSHCAVNILTLFSLTDTVMTEFLNTPASHVQTAIRQKCNNEREKHKTFFFIIMCICNITAK